MINLPLTKISLRFLGCLKLTIGSIQIFRTDITTMLLSLIVVLYFTFQNNDSSHRWKVEWCVTIPPGDEKRKNLVGTPAVVMRNRVVFFVSRR